MTKSTMTTLGQIDTVITGRKHYDVRVAPGERVMLTREPKNPHDKNAITVWNAREEKSGYLPRRIAVWLAPLLDAHKVHAAAEIAFSDPPRHGLTPLKLEVSLTMEAATLLQPYTDPQTLPQVLHNLVLNAYHGAADWAVEGLAEQVAERLNGLSEHGLFPETRLLLSVMPQQGRDAALRAMEAKRAEIKNLLLGLRVGKPMQHRNVTLFPLYLPDAEATPCLLLQEALEQGLAEVKELSEGASVSTLLVDNQGSQPLFIPEGEILSGAKQNRVVNLSVLVPAESSFKLPVSCVEQGRWNYVSPTFRASHYAPPRLRERMKASVIRNQSEHSGFESDQAGVWDDVSCLLRARGVQSNTASLTEGYEATRETTEDFRAHLALPEDCAGIAVGVGGDIIALDVFDAPATLRKLWTRLSDGYFMETARDSRESKDTPADCVTELLASIIEHAAPRKATLGLGSGFDVSAAALTASGLHYEGRLVHLAAFKNSDRANKIQRMAPVEGS